MFAIDLTTLADNTDLLVPPQGLEAHLADNWVNLPEWMRFLTHRDMQQDLRSKLSFQELNPEKVHWLAASKTSVAYTLGHRERYPRPCVSVFQGDPGEFVGTERYSQEMVFHHVIIPAGAVITTDTLNTVPCTYGAGIVMLRVNGPVFGVNYDE